MPRPYSFAESRRRCAAVRVFAGLCALALAAPALAQEGGTGGSTTTTNTSTAGGLMASALRVGGEDVRMGVIRVGIKECDANADIEFEINGVPEDSSVDVYLGEACNQTNARDSDGQADCEYVGNFEGGQVRQLPLTIKARQMMGENCRDDMQRQPKIWFLAVTNPGTNEDVKNLYAMLATLLLDKRRPQAPTGIQGGSGEKQIPLEWDATGSDLEGFIVLIDSRPTAGGGTSGSSGAGSGGSAGGDEDGGVDGEAPSGGGVSGDGECGSAVLTKGGLVSALPSSIKRKTINEATATGVDLSPGDIDGELATVAVVAVDDAGNESFISELACVRIVPTDGFWDRYQQDNEAVAGGCPCAAVGPAQLDTAWPVALALAFIARSARRRRRS